MSAKVWDQRRANQRVRASGLADAIREVVVTLDRWLGFTCWKCAGTGNLIDSDRMCFYDPPIVCGWCDGIGIAWCG